MIWLFKVLVCAGKAVGAITEMNLRVKKKKKKKKKKKEEEEEKKKRKKTQGLACQGKEVA